MPRPYVISAVTQRHLNRDHTLPQPSPYVISAVTVRYLSRGLTAEMPLKVGFSGRFTSRDVNLSALILQVRLTARLAASCAAARRSLVSGRVVYAKDKNKISRSVRP